MPPEKPCPCKAVPPKSVPPKTVPPKTVAPKTVPRGRRPPRALWPAALLLLLVGFGLAPLNQRSSVSLANSVSLTNSVSPGEGATRVLPLSRARRLPSSWPHPGPMLRSGPPGGVTPGAPSDAQTSANWGGLVETGTGARFTQISAMWTVPAVSAQSPGDSATWVGIDGFENGDLVQAGTDQSHGTYYAWYELIPQYAFSLGPVHAGDEMYVDVAQDVPGTWTVTVQDITRGVAWSGPVAYEAAESSAEWVEEAPTTGKHNIIETLADFNAVTFTDMSVEGPGTGAAKAAPIYLVNSHGQIKAYPSAYDPGTDSLEVRYGPAPDGIVGYPLASIPASSSTATTTTLVPRADHGYWLAAADGRVYNFGAAVNYGAADDLHLRLPVTGMAATTDDEGYWLVSADGGVFAYGDAGYYGSLPSLGFEPPGPGAGRHLNAPVVGIAASPGGRGYLLVTADGGVFAFGAAHFEGSCVDDPICGAPAVAVVPDASGDGYWLLLANADMVAFGDAPAITDDDCQSQAAAEKVTATAAAPTVDGNGYWVALQDGTTCAEGDALTEGIWEAQGPTDARDPDVAIVSDHEGQGAWLVMAGGNVDRYGDAPRLGGLKGHKPASPIVGAAGF